MSRLPHSVPHQTHESIARGGCRDGVAEGSNSLHNRISLVMRVREKAGGGWTSRHKSPEVWRIEVRNRYVVRCEVIYDGVEEFRRRQPSTHPE
jgi:hypothetical protein